MDNNDYRETGTVFRRSPLASPEGQGFAAKVRAVVADHARSLQGVLERAKREGGRYTQGLAGKRRTTLPDGVLVETWINPFGLTPTLMAKVYYPVGKKGAPDFYMESGLICDDELWTTNFAQLPQYWTYAAKIPDIYQTEWLLSLGSVGLPDYSPYKSRVYAELPTKKQEFVHLRPEWESGIAVEFLQALMGAGRARTPATDDSGDLADVALGVFVDKWRRKAYIPNKEGLAIIRAPNGDHFFVEEMVAYKMTGELGANGFPGSEPESKFAYSWMLAYMVPDYTVAYPLLVDGEIDRYYIWSDYFVPPRFADWYWQWSPQKGEDAPAEAYHARFARKTPEDSTAVYRTAHLVVEWDEDNHPVPTTLTLTDYDNLRIDRSKLDFYRVKRNTSGAQDGYAAHSGINTTDTDWPYSQLPTPREDVQMVENFSRIPLVFYWDKNGVLQEVALSLSGEWSNTIVKQDESNPVVYRAPATVTATYHREYTQQTYIMHIGEVDITQHAGRYTEHTTQTQSWDMPPIDVSVPAECPPGDWPCVSQAYIDRNVGTRYWHNTREQTITPSNFLEIVVAQPGCVWVHERTTEWEQFSDSSASNGQQGIYEDWYPPGYAGTVEFGTFYCWADYWHLDPLMVIADRTSEATLYVDQMPKTIDMSLTTVLGGKYIPIIKSAEGAFVYAIPDFYATEDTASWGSGPGVNHPNDPKQIRVWVGRV